MLLQKFRRTAFFENLRRSGNPTAAFAWLRFRGAVFYSTHGHVMRYRAIAKYVSSTEEPRLQLGSGEVTLPGWLNSDLVRGDIYIDVERPLPLPDARFAYVFAEHLIEHVSEQDGMQLLREIHRILRPGGVARITTPDLPKIIALYEDRNPIVSRADYARFLDDITGRRHERPCQIFNDFMRLWGHKYIYDEEDLAARLHQAGFRRVERQEPRQSEHPQLQDLERHGPEWENHAEAMCLEATRA